MPHALLVTAHPRTDSLTAQVATRARARLEATGHTVDLLDLYAEDFDPRLHPADEPDWENRDKTYSAEVQAHMRRITDADEIVLVFPIWWFGPPAILKGWIDRVWNYGFAYGRSKPRLAGKRLLWLALAGASAEEIEGDGWDAWMENQLVAGISKFCGIDDATLRFLYQTELSGVPADQRPARVATLLTATDTTLDTHLTHRPTLATT